MKEDISGQSTPSSIEKHSPNKAPELKIAEQRSITQQILNRSIEDQIRDRAYELYVQGGCQEGNAVQNWLDAEFELLANR